MSGSIPPVPETALIYGELHAWPPPKELADALRGAGLRLHVGRHAVRVADCDHFVFRYYEGDMGGPQN